MKTRRTKAPEKPVRSAAKPVRPRPVKSAPRDSLFEALRAELGL